MCRTATKGRGERHEYRPTAMAWGLYPVLVGLMQWGDTWFNDGEPPLRLVERSTGEPVRAAVVAGRVEELAPTSVRWEAGPSFHTIEERRRAPRKRAERPNCVHDSPTNEARHSRRARWQRPRSGVCVGRGQR